MSNTLAILGLDAADYELAKRWDLRNMLLDKNRKIETISYSLDIPATLEVWPTIATGLMPEKHGVILDKSGWENTAGLSIIARATKILPSNVRSELREAKENLIGGGFPQTNVSHVFEHGDVYNWPGITPCLDWKREGEWFRQAKDGEIADSEFQRRHLAHTGKAIGWLASQDTFGVPIAGVHVHILDHLGHMYAQRPSKLKDVYETVDSLIGWLRKQVDRLVIISDHGMQTTEVGDSDPGVHSWRSMFTTTEDGPLPATVSDVRAWVEQRIEIDEASEARTRIDAPTEHLKDLGYI